MNETLIIIPLYNQAALVPNILTQLSSVDTADILIVDDGSEDDTFELVTEYEGVKCLRHDQSLGFGSAIQNGLKFAADMGYIRVIFIDPLCRQAAQDISVMMENLGYGYDMVCCSRILENYDLQAVETSATEIIGELSRKIAEITPYDITDPLSCTRALNLESIKDMELTDETHGVFLQLIIQGAHFGLDIFEVPLSSDSVPFGHELDLYEDSLGLFLSLMETESFLYKRDTLN